MIISPAYAQNTGAGANEFLMTTVVPILLMFAIFYFLLFRPQQQRMKQHREMIDNVKRGDVIVTAGGMVAKVSRVKQDDPEIEVEIAENTRVKLLRHTITEVRSKNGAPEKA